MRCRFSSVGVVLFASILGICALLLANVDVGKAFVPAGAEGAVPALPQATPPPPPVVPSPPQVPTPPQAPVQIPSGPQVPAGQAPTVEPPRTSPHPSRSVHLPAPDGAAETPSSGVDLPSAVETAGATRRFSSDSTGQSHQPVGSTEPTHQAASSPRSSDGGGSGDALIPRARSEAGWIESARPAPLRVFFAYVWPAVALEAAKDLLAALQARLGIPTSRPASNGSAPSSGLNGVIEEGRVAGLSARSASPDPGSGDGRGLSVPFGGAIPTLAAIVACAALMALVAFTLGREFRSMPRWPR